MTQYGAIIDDGVPDDLGQSGSGVLADESLQTAYQFQWRLVNGRLIVEVVMCRVLLIMVQGTIQLTLM